MESADLREIIWQPTEEVISGSSLHRFMRRHGIGDLQEMVRRSTSDIEWFWRAALDDLGIEWNRPFTTLLDDSRGFPWCRWFTDGKINIVHNCVDRHARSHPDSIAVLWEGDGADTRRMTYRELAEEVTVAASALRALGIEAGDAIGFYMPMVPELIVAFFAVLKIGAVVTPVFSAFGPDALSARLQDAGTKLLFTADGSYRRGEFIPIKPSADEALRRVDCVRRVVVLQRTGADVTWNRETDITWGDFLRRGESGVETLPLDSEARSLIVYTSGTTGRPKGTVHTQAGVLAQVAKELGYFFDVKRGDRFFWLTDIGWMMGPWAIIGATFFGAACMIFQGAPDWPDAGRLWRLVERHQVTHLGISPTAIRILARAGEHWTTKHDLDSLRILGSTGEPWDAQSYAWFFRNVGKSRCPVINISGGTEIMGCLLACYPLAALRPCSFHGPGLGMDVDVVDDQARPIRGSRGYLVLRKPAPSLTRGFLNDPQRYLETYFSRWPGIWNHGDWARLDPDGFWFIEGRADDTIKVAGRRTGPAEIEAILIADPAVSEAAAIGVPDELKGENIVCFVVLKPNASPDETIAVSLAERVARALGKTLRPHRIHFVPSLPKTRSAKIVRGAIRRAYLGLPIGNVASIENPQALENIPVAPKS